MDDIIALSAGKTHFAGFLDGLIQGRATLAKLICKIYQEDRSKAPVSPRGMTPAKIAVDRKLPNSSTRTARIPNTATRMAS